MTEPASSPPSERQPQRQTDAGAESPGPPLTFPKAVPGLPTEPLRSVDFAWLRMDEPANLMIINGALVFERPVDPGRVRELIRERLGGVELWREESGEAPPALEDVVEEMYDGWVDGSYPAADLEFTGRAEEAEIHFRAARNLDTLRFRADGPVNRVIREVGEALTGEGEGTGNGGAVHITP